MAQLFSNNAVTTLAAGISAVAVELNVAPGKGDNFPVVTGGSGDYFIITMEDSAGNREFIRCDVRGAASDTLGSVTFPLQRGHFGTTARAWLLGDTVDLRFSAEAMNGLLTPAQSIIPDTTALYDIGSPTFQYRDLELSGQVNAATAVLSSTAQVGGLLTLLAGANITGNIAVSGTVDGVDIAARDHDSVTLAGALDYLTIVGQVITRNPIDLATDVSNDLPFANIAQIATDRLLGRVTAATGDIEVLTPTQVTAMLDQFTTTLQGLVPGSGGGTVNFLRADGTWATPPDTSPWNYTLQSGLTYTAAVGDFVVASNTGAVTITLPAGHAASDTIIVKKSGSGGTVTVDANGAETIDGVANYVMGIQYESVTLISDGANWLIV